MRTKSPKPKKEKKVFIGARVLPTVKTRLENRAESEHRSLSALLEMTLNREAGL